MDQILYTKYSTERRTELKIKTCILEGTEGRYILKCPMSDAAGSHVASIYDHYVALSGLYEGSGIQINHCEPVPDSETIRFSYVTGTTFEQHLDAYMARQDYLGILDEIRLYKKKLLDCLEQKQFVCTKGFRSVFGDVEIPMPLEAVSVANIDLIFGNIIIDAEGKWNIIDYEWTFDFDVPVNFILYRAICDYLYSSNKRDELWHLNLLQLFGISEAEQQVYKCMDRAFHSYVNGDSCPLALLSNEINNTKYVVNDLLVRYIPGQVQVFYDYGSGYSEEDSEFMNCQKAEDGRYTLRIDKLSQVKQVRIDPTNQYCIIDIRDFQVTDMEGGRRDAVFYNNGEHIGDTMYVYNTDDPQWVVPEIDSGIQEIEVNFYITTVSKEIAGICSTDGVLLYNSSLEVKQLCATQEEAIREKEDENQKLRQDCELLQQECCSRENANQALRQECNAREGENQELRQLCAAREAVIQDKEHVIEEMLQSTSWKLTKPVRWLGKKH